VSGSKTLRVSVGWGECNSVERGMQTVDEALECKKTGQKKVIAFNLLGHGHFDMMAYDAYHNGKLEDYLVGPLVV